MERKNIWGAFRKALVVQGIVFSLIVFNFLLSFAFHTGMLDWIFEWEPLYIIVNLFGPLVSLVSIGVSIWMVLILRKDDDNAIHIVLQKFRRNLILSTIFGIVSVIFYLIYWSIGHVKEILYTTPIYSLTCEIIQVILLLISCIFSVKTWYSFLDQSFDQMELLSRPIRFIQRGFIIQCCAYILWILLLLPYISEYKHIIRAPIEIFTAVWLLIAFFSFAGKIKQSLTLK